MMPRGPHLCLLKDQRRSNKKFKSVSLCRQCGLELRPLDKCQLWLFRLPVGSSSCSISVSHILASYELSMLVFPLASHSEAGCLRVVGDLLLWCMAKFIGLFALQCR